MMEDAWKNFELSGKIEDYLNYRQEALGSIQKQDMTQAHHLENSVFSDRGMGSYGTEHSSDRNGVKCNADWRV